MKVWIIKSSDNQGKNFCLFLKKNVLNMTQVATVSDLDWDHKQSIEKD